MMKSSYLITGLFLIIMLAGFVVAVEQNYTVAIIKINSDGDSITIDDIDSITAKCDGESYSIEGFNSSEGLSFLYFESEFCDGSSEIVISLTDGDFQINDKELDVQICDVGDSICASNSDTEKNVVNYAFGVLNLEEVVPEPVVKKSSGGSSGSSSKKVVKNSTIVSVPKSNDSVEADIADIANPEELEFNQTNEEEQDAETTSGITGAVIGAIKGNAGFVALLFIAAVLVAYMFVLKRRRSSASFY